MNLKLLQIRLIVVVSLFKMSMTMYAELSYSTSIDT